MNRHESKAVCSKLLYREPLVLTVPDNQPLAGRAAVTMTDRAGQPMILLPWALDPLEEQLPNLVPATSSSSPLMVGEAITLESAYSGVAAGLAVAVVVESTARTMAVPGVLHRPFGAPAGPGGLSVAQLHGRMSTAVRSFLMITSELAAVHARERANPPGHPAVARLGAPRVKDDARLHRARAGGEAAMTTRS